MTYLTLEPERRTQISGRGADNAEIRLRAEGDRDRHQETQVVMPEAPKLKTIYRYPVKGLSPESLARTTLAIGQPIAGDRAYAIGHTSSAFDPAVPAYLSKTHFLMLMRNHRLGALQTRLDEASHVLTVVLEGREAAAGDLTTAEGRAAIEDFFALLCADELRGPPRVMHAPGHSFSDEEGRFVSIINLASVAAIEGAIGATVDPLRFRGNLYVEGWPAWGEFDLVGREIRIGGAVRLKVIKCIERCAATNVDPKTGISDRTIPISLMRSFGHINCGVYAEVVAGGEIAAGNAVTAAP